MDGAFYNHKSRECEMNLCTDIWVSLERNYQLKRSKLWPVEWSFVENLVKIIGSLGSRFAITNTEIQQDYFCAWDGQFVVGQK